MLSRRALFQYFLHSVNFEQIHQELNKYKYDNSIWVMAEVLSEMSVVSIKKLKLIPMYKLSLFVYSLQYNTLDFDRINELSDIIFPSETKSTDYCLFIMICFY